MAVRTCATAPGARLARRAERGLGLSAQRPLPGVAPRHVLGAGRRRCGWLRATRRLSATRARCGKTVVLFVRHLQRHFESRERAGRGARAAGRRLHRAHVAPPTARRTVLRPHVPRDRHGPRRRTAKAAALVDALLPFADAGITIVGLEPSCLLTLRDEYLAMGLGARPQHGGGAGAAVRGVRRARSEGRPLRAGVGRTPSSRSSCTAIATRRRSARWTPMLDVLRLIPGAQAAADRQLVLRHGRQLRLRGERTMKCRCSMAEAVAAAGGARREPTPSSWPTAPVAATRSPTARRGRHCTWRRCWRFTWLTTT